MAYDEALAERIRDLLVGTPGLVEKKMFGGVGFTIHGHMATGCHKGGDLMIRCGKADWPVFCAEPGARAMERGGKGLSGWVIVDGDTVEGDEALALWVHRGRDHAASMPPK